jgi:sulfur carrier protein ThiS
MTLHTVDKPIGRVKTRARGGKVLLLTGPFGEPERMIALQRPMAVADVIDRHGLSFRLPTIAVLNGEPVLRGEWPARIVGRTDTLAFVAVPGGGNSGKQIAGLVAAIALTVAAPWAGAAIFGAGTLGASLFSAAVIAGGSVLLNAVLPQTSQDSSATATSVFAVSAANNDFRPLDVMPVLYGKMRYTPPFASRSYSEYAGNDQFLYQLFCVTTGKAGIEKIEIGDTEAWNSVGGYSASFSDLEFQIVQPGGAITLFPANVVTSDEVAGQTVPDPAAVLGPFVVNAAGTTIDKIAVDFAFPGGLFSVGDGRTIGTRTAKLRAQYRPIDNAGAPVGPGTWTNIFQETISLATRTPQRLTRSAAVAAARYEVKFFAEQAFATDDTVAVDAAVWAGLRGYLTGFETPADCTLIAMKVKANEQLSQASASQVFVTAQRYLPTHPGGAWTAPASTRSIAWAAADLLRDSGYGLGLADRLLDIEALKTLDVTWAGRGDTFNTIFSSATTAKDALTTILRAGRAQHVRMGGQIGFTRLEAKAIRRAVFSPRNVVRGSFSHKLVLFDEDHPDSVNASYLDETVWTERQVLCSLASVGSDAPQAVDYVGITDHDQAWREGVTDAAINAYQREFVSFTAEWEGKLLIRGEPILVMHPFIENVSTASAKSVAGAAITLDRDVTVPGGDKYLILRAKDGREWGPCLVSGVAGRVWTLDAADKASVEADMGTLASIVPAARAERMHVLVCAGETRPFNGLVVSATPDDSGKVSIVSVIDAPEVYEADGTETTPSPWVTPTLPGKVPERPTLSGLYASLRAGYAGLEVDAMWLPAAGATGGYIAQISYDGGDSWTHLYEGTTNRFTRPVGPQTSKIRVAAVGKFQGPWATRTFDPGEVPDHLLAPGSVSITEFADGISAPQVVDALVDAVATENALAVLTTDGRLYRYHSGAWTLEVPANVLSGQIVTSQIATAAITANELASAAVTAVKLAALSVATANIQVAAVTSAIIANNAVQTANIAALAITSAELAANAVTTSKINAAAVTSAIIANGAVQTANIAALAVTSSELGAAAVLTSKINTAAVTSAIIANNAVQTANLALLAVTAATVANATLTGTQIAAATIAAGNIVSGTITTTQIAAGTITATNIAATTITAAKIVAGTITTTEIAATTIIAGNIAATTITAAKIVSGTITTTQIAAGTITATNIAAGTITATQITAGTITTNEIAATTIVAGNIAATTITAAKIVSGTITTTQIAAGTITATNIAAGTITASNIAAGAITTTEIAAGTIVAANIAAGTITGAKIAAATITGDLLVAAAITARELVLTDYRNLVPNGDWEVQDFTSFWTSANFTPTFISGNGNFVKTGTSAIILDKATNATLANITQAQKFPVEGGKDYYFETTSWANGTGGSAGFNPRVQWFDVSGALISTDNVVASGNIDNTYRVWSNTFTAPGTARSARLAIFSLTTASSTRLVIDHVIVRKKDAATLIVDGGIVAGQIAANTITANEIAANTLTAATIAAGAIGATQLAANAVTAGKINAGAISTSSLMVDGVVITAKVADGAITDLSTHTDNTGATTPAFNGSQWIPVGTGNWPTNPVKQSLTTYGFGVIVSAKIVHNFPAGIVGLKFAIFYSSTNTTTSNSGWVKIAENAADNSGTSYVAAVHNPTVGTAYYQVEWWHDDATGRALTWTSGIISTGALQK